MTGSSGRGDVGGGAVVSQRKPLKKMQYILYLYYYLCYYLYYLYYYLYLYYLFILFYLFFYFNVGKTPQSNVDDGPPHFLHQPEVRWARVVEGAAAKKYNIFYLIIFILLFFDYLNRKTHPFQRCQWRSVTSAED